MSRRIAVNIADTNPETGMVEVFVVGESLPAWAAARVTNPDVWADGPGVGDAPAPDAVVEVTAADVARSIVDGGPVDLPGGGSIEAQVSVVDEPPRSGKGSGLDAWRTFAEGLGIDTEGMDRSEIIEAVDALDEDID